MGKYYQRQSWLSSSHFKSLPPKKNTFVLSFILLMTDYQKQNSKLNSLTTTISVLHVCIFASCFRQLHLMRCRHSSCSKIDDNLRHMLHFPTLRAPQDTSTLVCNHSSSKTGSLGRGISLNFIPQLPVIDSMPCFFFEAMSVPRYSLKRSPLQKRSSHWDTWSS